MRAPSRQPPNGGHHPGPPTPTPRQPQGTLGSSPGWEPFSGTRGWGWNAGADSRSPPARSEARAPLDSAGLVSAASGSGAHGTDRPQPPALPQCPRSGGHAPCSPGRDGQVSTGTACLYGLLPPGTAPYPPVPTACSRGGGALRAPGLLGGPGQLQWASCWPAGLRDRCPSPERGSAAHQLSTPAWAAAKGKGQGCRLGDSALRP